MSDLVVVSLEPWDDVWRRNQHLLTGLLQADRELRVLFVEPAADPLHDISARRRPQFGRAGRAIGDTGRLWALRPLKPLPRKLDRNADDRLAGAVVRAARKLDMHAPVLWINDPGQARLLELTGWPTLYDITDDWLVADRSATESDRLRRAENVLLAEADEVVACSPELVRRKTPLRTLSRAPITLIRNAVDTAAYRRPTVRPADLPAGKTAVYMGTLHADRLDIELCEHTARTVGSELQLVLVGPNSLDPIKTDRLIRSGVVLLGPRSHTDVVGYLQHADVLVVPHTVNSFTDSLDPIKLYEYLAVGRPVVATPVAGFRDTPEVTVVDPDRFADELLSAVQVGSRSTTKAAVADWSDRVAAMRLIIDRMR